MFDLTFLMALTLISSHSIQSFVSMQKKNTRIGVANTRSLLLHSYSIMKVALVMKTSYTRN